MYLNVHGRDYDGNTSLETVSECSVSESRGQGNEPVGKDDAQRMGSGIYLRLALVPTQKTLVGKIVTKVS